jgi:hypothetical protein
VVRGEGVTLNQAIRRASLNVPQPVTLSHLEVLVIGRSVLAPRPLSGCLDGLLRSPLLVRTFWVYGTLGPASGIAHAVNPIGLYPAQVLIRASDRAARNAFIAPQRFERWVQSLENAPEAATLLPILTADHTAPPGTGADYRFPGSFLLRRDRVVGEMRPQQTVLWFLIAPHAESDGHARPLITVRDGRLRMAFVVEAHRTRLVWRPDRLSVTVSVGAGLDEVNRPHGSPFIPPPGGQTAMRRALAWHLARALFHFIRWTQRRDLDVLAISRLAAAQDPAWYRAHAAQWSRIYPRLPVTVHVDVIIENTGNLYNP